MVSVFYRTVLVMFRALQYKRRFKDLDYATELRCLDCGLRGLVQYVEVRKCGHIVCVFCRDKHILRQCVVVDVIKE